MTAFKRCVTSMLCWFCWPTSSTAFCTASCDLIVKLFRFICVMRFIYCLMIVSGAPYGQIWCRGMDGDKMTGQSPADLIDEADLLGVKSGRPPAKVVGHSGDVGRPPAGTIGHSGDVVRPPARTIEHSGDVVRPPARAIEHSGDVVRPPAGATGHSGDVVRPPARVYRPTSGIGITAAWAR